MCAYQHQKGNIDCSDMSEDDATAAWLDTLFRLI